MMEPTLHKNVGPTDQLLRVTMGVIIVTLGYFDLLPFSFWVSTFVIIFGMTQILEGIMGY